jgi:hypothetical protein
MKMLPVLLIISLTAHAHAGEIADCVFDRNLEYAHNSEPATVETALRALMTTLKVCVGHDASESEMAEVYDGMRRAQQAIEDELAQLRGENS